MKQAILLFAITAIGITACNNDKKNDKPATGNDTLVNTTLPDTATPATYDSAAIRTVIIDFYKWYTANYTKLMKFDLYSSIKKNNGAPYQLNPDQVTKYQQFIRDSVPQLGAAFLEDQTRLFQKIDSAFKKDVKEDVPYYFDFDWYTNSQEDPSYLLDGITKSNKWIINVAGDKASVEIGAPEDKNYISGSLLIYIGLKKENGQWKIANIGND